MTQLVWLPWRSVWPMWLFCTMVIMIPPSPTVLCFVLECFTGALSLHKRVGNSLRVQDPWCLTLSSQALWDAWSEHLRSANYRMVAFSTAVGAYLYVRRESSLLAASERDTTNQDLSACLGRKSSLWICSTNTLLTLSSHRRLSMNELFYDKTDYKEPVAWEEGGEW